MVLLVAQNEWRNTDIVTNDYHIPRCQEMMKQLATLSSNKKIEIQKALEMIKDKNLQINFVSADTVLPLRNEHYTSLIEKVHNSEAYKERVALEERGLQRLQQGSYGIDKK